MTFKYILDTGPLVALLSADDHYHDWAKYQFSKLSPPVLTCQAVLTETCFLISQNPNGYRLLFSLFKKGLIIANFEIQAYLEEVDALMYKYSNVPMSFADACLVQLSALFSQAQILTLDSDFFIYRNPKGMPLPVIHPDTHRL